MKKTFLALSLVGSLAQADEVGPVYILSQSCNHNSKNISCEITTSGDLGGAEYKLKFDGDAFAHTPVLQLLPILVEKKISVYLNAHGLRSEGSNLVSGTFSGIIVKAWND